MGRPREHDEQTASALLVAAERTIHEHGIGALGARAFELLQAGLETLPESDDPCDDLVEAGLMFRRFALGHSALFSIGIQVTEPSLWPRFRAAASEALAALHRRVERLADAGLLGDRSVHDAAMQFHALCEGLAALELRRGSLATDPEQFWRNALRALIAGFAESTPPIRRRATRRVAS